MGCQFIFASRPRKPMSEMFLLLVISLQSGSNVLTRDTRFTQFIGKILQILVSIEGMAPSFGNSKVSKQI